MAGTQPPGLLNGSVFCWPRMTPPLVVWNQRSRVNGVVRDALDWLLVGEGEKLSGSWSGELAAERVHGGRPWRVVYVAWRGRVPFGPAAPLWGAVPSPRHQWTASLVNPPLSVAVMVTVAEVSWEPGVQENAPVV